MLQKKQKKFIDIAGAGNQQEVVGFGSAKKATVSESVLFSRGKKTDAFFTEDSKLYITPREQKLLRSGVRLDRDVKKWDALSSRVVKRFVRFQPSRSSILLEALEKRYEMFNDSTAETARTVLNHFTVVRLWNASIIGSILFGMVMMTFVYKYLGQGAKAEEQALAQTTSVQQVEIDAQSVVAAVDIREDAEAFARQMAQIQQAESQKALEDEIRAMVKGYPIEKMVPYIAEQDRTVAAFIVAIAKKESAWGVRVPVLNGQDCYNYWGYRQQRVLMGTGGHTCFNSRQDAVETVAKRIATLVEEYGKETPAEMVLWKCGTACASDSGAAKWISDVNSIFSQFNTQEDIQS